MSETRASFVERFGEDEAQRIEAAADEHATDVNGGERGEDGFRWAILIVIGYQCAEVDRYREHHGIVAPWAEIKQWIKDHGNLAQHKGDMDYLALFAGTYNEYMPPTPVQSA